MTLLKRDNLFIHKEEKMHENRPDTVVYLYILFLLDCKTYNIQAMTMWPRKFNAVPYYIWNLGATIIIDKWIVVGALSMLEDT